MRTQRARRGLVPAVFGALQAKDIHSSLPLPTWSWPATARGVTLDGLLCATRAEGASQQGAVTGRVGCCARGRGSAIAAQLSIIAAQLSIIAAQLSIIAAQLSIIAAFRRGWGLRGWVQRRTSVRKLSARSRSSVVMLSPSNVTSSGSEATSQWR